MRKINAGPIIVFLLIFVIILALTLTTATLFYGLFPTSDLRGIGVTILGIALIYIYAFAVYRIFLFFFPLQEGYQQPGSRDEFIANLNIIFYLILFNTLVRTNFLPVPALRVVYKILGAKMGENSYSAGAILDPPLTRMGKNCIVGHNAVLFSHAIEGPRLSLSAIEIGDDVTIGALAVIMSGVVIKNNAIVSAGAVVLKDTRIGEGEIWGGVPARRIK